ncbi:MAG: hypothetical protein HY390_05065 [Deltaproteobacteria bacterium]|nr:hypothetical protein [Deltaproteobacteria bacterium]
MFHLIGFEQNLETLILLAKPYAGHKNIYDLNSLKKAYFRFLKKIQPNVPLPQKSTLEFVSNPELIAKLIKLFMVDTELNDIENIMNSGNASYAKKALNNIQQSYQRLLERNPSFGSLFNLVVNMIFCAQSKMAGGGTTSAAIGVIWSDHRPHWQNQDFIEFFIHETSHTLLFLDEYRYQHYRDLKQVAKPENYTPSAILQKNRPLDKVLHSLIVATEILLARSTWLGEPSTCQLHPPTSILLPQTRNALSSLQNASLPNKLLTERAHYLLETIQQKIAPLEHPLQTTIEGPQQRAL